MPSVSIFGSGRVTAQQSILGDGVVAAPGGTPRDWEATGTGSVDGSTSEAARPRAGTTQEAGLEVHVAGSAVNRSWLVGGIGAERDWSRPIQTWDFAVDVPDDGIGHFGSPYGKAGPALDKREVEVYGVYRTTTGVHRYPIIRHGRCDQSQRTAGGGGYVETFNGVDAGGRVDRREVTFVAPAGHGLTREAVIRRLLLLSGETRFQLTRGATMFKEVQAVDANPLRLALELMETEGRRVLWNRDGYVVNPRPGQRGDRPILVTLEERDILSASAVSVNLNADVITDLTLTGTQQVVRDDEEQCGHETKVSEVELTATFISWLASFSQSGACTLTSLNPPSLAREQPLSLTRTTLELKCGVLVSETVEVWAPKRIETARYSWASGVRSCRPCFLGADGTTEGAEAAYAESFERWRLISRTVTRHFYNRSGYGGPLGNPTDPWHEAFHVDPSTLIDDIEQNPPAQRNYKRGTITESYGYSQVRRAVKAAVPATPWEEIDPQNGLTLGNGEGVSDANEVFRLTNREIEVLHATDDGYLETRFVYSYGYTHRPGSAFQYADGSESANGADVFDLTGWQQETWTATSEGQVSQVTARFDFDGAPRLAEPVRRESGPGAPPAVERIQPEGAEQFDPTLFDTPEEAEAARTARPTESVRIEARVSSPELERWHERRQVTTTVPWAETAEELSLLGFYTLLTGAAMAVTFTTPADYLLAEGDWIQLKVRPIGVDHDVEIQSVRHNDTPGTPALSTFTANIYPAVGIAA